MQNEEVRMKKIARIIILILCLLFLNFSDKANASEVQTKEILILHSYHSGFPWTDGQTNGILDSMASYHGNYNLSIEYLDWKRYPTEKNLEQHYQSLKYKYEYSPIDVVLCTDDAAFRFALLHRSEIFNNAPVVFSGVNSAGLDEIAQGYSNYTGIIERMDPEETYQLAKLINPELSKVYLIYDNSESGLSTGGLFVDAAQKLDSPLETVTCNDKSTEEILSLVTRCENDSMVLVLNYFSDIDGSSLNHAEFCRNLAAASSVPVYLAYDYSSGTGVLGGHVLSGYNQGHMAGDLALRILNGEEASDIEIISPYSDEYIFDYNVLVKYDIPMSILPKGSQIINKPFNFFETYRQLVITVAVIFALLVAFVIILLIYIRRIRVLQRVLADRHKELLELYDDQTASEEELRAQYDEITQAHEKLEDYSLQLYYQAYHDILTGLYNRSYLIDVFEKELQRGNVTGSLFFIDLDNFKYVNDALGHSIGDDLLREISARLLTLSGANNTVTRLGGDEFVMFVHSLHSEVDIRSFAEKIIQLFISPFEVSGNILNVTVSIGIAIYPENGSTLDEILQNADMAMFRVKSKGRNGYYFYQRELKQELLERLGIEKRFEKALQNQEFLLYYQPLIQIPGIGKCVIGLEALVRWKDPELGIIPPYKFIPIAEETGFITKLGTWILHTACAQIVRLNQMMNKEFEISVNISVIQLMQVDFLDIVIQTLKETGLQPHLLNLEITESIIMESIDLFQEKLKALRSIGVHISLDDFGTGYSSLAYLRDIPITTLKIDKSFISDIIKSNLDNNMVDTIINLGHKLNLTVVAEGVETEEQLLYLIQNNCDVVQGYYYAKPLPVEELEKYLQD